MGDLTWKQALIGSCIAFIGWCVVVVALEGKRRISNRKINLPPPSVACRRNGPEAAP